MKFSSTGRLGVLQLQNTPMTLLGALSNPNTFSFPTLCRKVPGAWVSNVVNGDASVEGAFVSTAKALVAEGAVAIVTNCGFAIRYQSAMSQAVPVPVASSALMMLPFLEVSTDARIGLLTFDSRPLTKDLLSLAGTREPDRIVVAGLEDAPSWAIMSRPDAPITGEQLEDDVLSAVRQLCAKAPDVSVLLFECAGFGPASARIREETGLPVYDVITLTNLVMAGTVGAPGFRG